MNMTDTIKHHLTPEILMAYSAGTLPEAFGLIVATHVSMCDTCRSDLASYDAVGGVVMEDAKLANVSDDAFAATMKLISAGDSTPLTPRRSSGTLPSPLQDYVGGDLDQIKWKPLGMGVKQAILPTSKAATARLLYIPAGAAVPDHGHNGTEMTLVLQGAFVDEDDRFARGDVEVANEDLEHTPIADVGEDCICLAVTDAPLKFNAFLPRLAQRFLRI
jgi:putative transcriptional regulator